jgi:hypothetical protein
VINNGFLIGLILASAWTIILLFVIGRWKFMQSSGVPIKWIKVGFIIKLVFGIALSVVYSGYYTERIKADTFRYFDDSQIMFNAIHESPADFMKMLTGVGSEDESLKTYYDQMNNWYDIHSPVNDNRATIRINALIRFVSWGHYQVHLVFFCFLAMIGIVSATASCTKFHKHASPSFFLCFLLIPSVVFWSSGVLKDTLATCMLGISLYFLVTLERNWKWTYLGLLMALLGLFVVRFQLFLLVAPALIAWIISTENKSKLSVPLSYLAIILLTLGCWELVSDKSLITYLQEKRNAFITLGIAENATSLFSTDTLDTSLQGFCSTFLSGFLDSWIRPMPWNSSGLLAIVSGLENLILISLVLYCLYLIIRKPTVEWSNFFSICIMIGIIYLCIVGMVTPVAGALVRYKALVLPYIIGPILIASGLHKDLSKILVRRLFK